MSLADFEYEIENDYGVRGKESSNHGSDKVGQEDASFGPPRANCACVTARGGKGEEGRGLEGGKMAIGLERDAVGSAMGGSGSILPPG
ncbi:hypothetical protein BHE74_00015019 [Ensete ventricosum]|uniref:Uncharacterized protein n=1 Tax=Ensete ventricosum TaxID=4639 RepID=A0A444C4E0_ENSVE|nr:hypothetical protein GW17_00057952 [Ensete ventricosum]RWW76853.1 hypothetical protein BHE74_00015019 [Ensete ventricosum]RZR73257.1 hypothetical protein BHM03_00021911 [Ensete ventricosum]